jgi:hypothetical protein
VGGEDVTHAAVPALSPPRPGPSPPSSPCRLRPTSPRPVRHPSPPPPSASALPAADHSAAAARHRRSASLPRCIPWAPGRLPQLVEWWKAAAVPRR